MITILFVILIFTIVYGSTRSARRRKLKRQEAKRKTQEKKHLRMVETSGINDTFGMDGHEFEYWCANLLQRCGFNNVSVTPWSGDQGVDILGFFNGQKYAIQCKCFHKNLGNKPVQEIVAGKTFYNCDIAAVMTNSYFTMGARQLAEKTNVLLLDRDALIRMLINSKQGQYRNTPDTVAVIENGKKERRLKNKRGV